MTNGRKPIHRFVENLLEGRFGLTINREKTKVVNLKQEGASLNFLGYPRIGLDDRNQFDFHRDQPGALKGLREVVDELYYAGAAGLHDYNPWDTGTRREAKVDLDDARAYPKWAGERLPIEEQWQFTLSGHTRADIVLARCLQTINR